MAYCRSCGAELPEGMRCCPACGAYADGMRTAQPEYTAPKKKPIYKKWWFWAVVVFVLMLIGAQRNPAKIAPEKGTEIAAAASPAAAVSTPAAVSAEPTAAVAAAETEIRPEVKEFLDSYEAFMDEYAAFMQRYENASAADLADMMGEYAGFLNRFAEFEEKLDAMDESELTTAEAAYYLEVTSRVSQKLLLAAG